MRIDDDIYAMAVRVGRAALARKLRLATAESCTGGLIAGAITAVAGSSDWFDRGFVTYSNDAKVKLLGVSKRTLGKHGAVSEETAREMARGALRRSRAQASVAVTGIAGPGGGSRAKPVGLVWFAWAGRGVGVQTRAFLFPGDRATVRRKSVSVAIQGLIQLLG